MNDILGEAMMQWYQRRSKARLWVNNRYGPREEMPINIYFRDITEMPELEWVALQQCRGSILDIGAGAGSHALALQQLGQEVSALDISPKLAELMVSRGVKKVFCKDVFALRSRRYDTLLLLMNGIGLAGNLDGLRRFLKKARMLLRPGGQLLFDSSDVAYLYNGKPPKPKGDEYYGAIFYQYEYRRQRSDWFQWLFIDRKTLTRVASEEGWVVELVFDAGRHHYLVRCKVC
jgi:SAM-dependent methyltransferase